MRLSSRKNRGASLELQMTSMIDVVFLLLIFFMTTSSFVHSERELDPELLRREPPAKPQRTLEPLVVEIVFNGREWGWKIGEREVFTRTELKSMLQAIDDRADGAFVRPAADAPFEFAAIALQHCLEAGFKGVKYDPGAPAP